MAFVTCWVQAQTAQLQIIHNSPTPTVDIWVNGNKLLDTVKFRTATAFLDVPAGVDLEVGVAPSPSTSVNDIIATATINLQEDKAYVAMARGIVGDMSTPFAIDLLDGMRTAASDVNSFAFQVYHGSTDAPTVDAIARGVAKLADDLSYGERTAYIEVPAVDYTVDVTDPQRNEIIVASYTAPLSLIRGGSAVVFASGFLSPANPGDPAFGLFAALADGQVLALPAVTNSASLQIIHNSPSPTVDIWVNGQKTLDSVAYRTATGYLTLPAGADLNIGIAPYPSNDTSDIIANFGLVLDPDQEFIAMATGIVGDMATPFNLIGYTPARSTGTDSNNVDFVIYHGSTDAPSVDIDARGVANLATGLEYGAFTNYISVPAADYTIDVRPNAASELIVASYTAPLSGLAGQSAVVFASGFLNPGMMDPGFGVFAALADGTVIELPAATAEANVQIIHNSPSPTVDIWVNGQKAIDSVAFRTATNFLTLPAGTPLQVGVAPSPSSDPSEIIATLDAVLNPDQNYVVMANGVVGSMQTPFEFTVIDDIRLGSNDPDNVDFVIVHGSPDAPTVDVLARGVATLADDISFGEFTDYIEVPAADYIVDITPADDNRILALSYFAPLATGRGASAVVFASGFLNPADTSETDFGLFVALPNGIVIPLPEVENIAGFQLLHNSPSPLVDVYVNDVLALDSVPYLSATEMGEATAGLPIKIGIAPSPSTDTSDVIAEVEVILEPNVAYIAIANGVVGDTTTPFEFVLLDNVLVEASDDNSFAVGVFHGSPDAPAVDATLRDVAPAATNLAFGEATDYVEIPAADYVIDLAASADPMNVLLSYNAPLAGLGGEAGLVFASGFLNPADTSEADFGLYLLLTDGSVIPLEREIVNTTEVVDFEAQLIPNITRNENIQLTWNANGQAMYEVMVVNRSGQLLRYQEVPTSGEKGQYEVDVTGLNAGQYHLVLKNGQSIQTKSFVVQ